MAYTLSATLQSRMDVRETVDSTTSPASAAGGNERRFTEYSQDVVLNGDSFPPIAGEAVDLSHTLAGTTKDFDLTSAPCARDVSEAVDKSGKKLVGIILRFATDNDAAGVAFGPQGANGYDLWGSGIVPTFYPGDQVLLFSSDPDQLAALSLQRPAVAAGAKDLRFTGAIGDSWKCLLIFNG